MPDGRSARRLFIANHRPPERQEYIAGALSADDGVTRVHEYIAVGRDDRSIVDGATVTFDTIDALVRTRRVELPQHAAGRSFEGAQEAVRTALEHRAIDDRRRTREPDVCIAGGYPCLAVTTAIRCGGETPAHLASVEIHCMQPRR